MRGRTRAGLAVAVLVLVAGVVAGALLGGSDRGGSDPVRETGTRDGRAQLSVPADWTDSECELPQDDCLVLRPSGGGPGDRISVILAEPNPVEGDLFDLLLGPELPPEIESTIDRLTVGGQPAVRLDDDKIPDSYASASRGPDTAADSIMIYGFLPGGTRGANFTVWCQYDVLEQQVRAACDTVVKSMTFPMRSQRPSPAPSPSS